MPRLTLDSVNFGSLATTKWPHLVGYLNGHVSAWSAEEIAETRAAGQLLAVVDVLGNSPLSASVLDFERGDVQSPTVVRAWLQARNQYRSDGTVYCSPSSIPTVVSGLRGEKCNLWVVDLTADGEPPFDVPAYPGLPDGVRVIARQFVLAPRSGGNYDISVFYADDWHPEQQAPAVLAAARMAAAPELGHYAAAAVADTVQLPGQLHLPEPDPKPEDSPGGTTSSAPPSAPSPGSWPTLPTADASISPAMAAAAAGTVSPAPAPDSSASSSTLQPIALLRADGRDSGRTVFEPAPVDADPLFTEHELAASRRAVAAAVNAPSLDHDFIRSTLKDLGDVAALFRHGGWGNIAGELERVAGIAWEIGSALKSAGL